LRAFFVTQYGALAASSRTRVLQYLPFLRQQGIDADVLTVLPDHAISGSQLDVRRQPLRKTLYYLWAAWRTWSCGLRTWWHGRSRDLLFVQKVIFPPPIRWLLRHMSTPVVYDFDDAIFTTEVRSGHWLARVKESRNASGVPAMLGLADLAVVENEYTAEFARQHCDVLQITGPIDTTSYAEIRSRVADTDPFTVGWIGSGSTVAYLELIAPVLQRLARELNLRLLVVGAQFELHGVDVECKPWALEQEATDLARCHVGVMPVPDDPWTRGKGGYKLLQYMAASLPVVTDPVGINVEIVASGESGLLVEGEDGWEAGLARLIEDGDLRQRLGAAGRDRVEAMYSQGVQQDQLLTMLRQVAGVPA